MEGGVYAWLLVVCVSVSKVCTVCVFVLVESAAVHAFSLMFVFAPIV